MKCPSCTTTLQITSRQGIEIDYCPQCRGVWLDRGELDKLIDREYQFTALRRRDDDDDDDVRKLKRDDDHYPRPERGTLSPERGALLPDRDDRYDDRPRTDTTYPTRRYDDDDDRYEYDTRYHPSDPRYRRRKSFLGQVFDFLD
jgi:Zn-finger nucleic acid-binding protein